VALPKPPPTEPIDPGTGTEQPGWDDAAQRMVDLAIADLAANLGIAPEEIFLVAVDPVDWPDSSLGLPEDGMMYLQVITPGFRMVLGHAEDRYVYHTDADDTVLPGKSPADPADPTDPAELRRAMLIRRGWRNADRPCDVNGDDHVTPRDALDLINAINGRGTGTLESVADFLAQHSEAAYLAVDVNADGQLTPYDVLLVIQELNGAAGGVLDGAVPAIALSGPLADFADWQAIDEMLQSTELAGLLGEWNLSPAEARAWVQEVLAGIDVGQVLVPSPRGGLLDQLLASPAAQGSWANWLPADIDLARARELARQANDLWSTVDLDQIFPSLADDVAWSLAGAEVRDAFFRDLLSNAG
jgi:hypothetical protein